MVATETFERTLQQRHDALERANKIRTHRARLKRDVKHGERLPREVLAAPEDELATMKVFEFLLAAPKVGRVKANKMLTAARCSPSKTIGGLSPRQRTELVAMVAGVGARR